jgi:predicted nucleic acid-binding protein
MIYALDTNIIIHYNYTLVTNNVKHFDSIAGLNIVDWLTQDD